MALENQNRAWLGLLGKKTLTQDYSLWSEAQLRYDLEVGGMQQTLFRFGPLKQINENHEIGLLMAFVQTGLIKEYRPTLQHMQQLSGRRNIKLSSRSRLEARFLEDSSDDSMRFRYLLRGQMSLNSSLSLILWDEAFINLTNDDWTGNRTVERNRLFVGFRIPITEMSIEIGYLNQHIYRRSDLIEHALVFYLFL